MFFLPNLLDTMNLILLGPPGTGKGTIARFINQRFSCEHISTGDLLREEVVSNTKTGKEIKEIMNQGKLVDDSIVLAVLKKRILKSKNFVLDGFPRNLKQAEIFDALLNELGVSIDSVLEIDSTEEIIIKRLTARRQCPKCKRIYGLDVPAKKEGICNDDNEKLFIRDDDKEAVVKERLKLYKKTTLPLVDFYKKKGLLVKVDGNRSLQNIFGEVERVLTK